MNALVYAGIEDWGSIMGVLRVGEIYIFFYVDIESVKSQFM